MKNIDIVDSRRKGFRFVYPRQEFQIILEKTYGKQNPLAADTHKLKTDFVESMEVILRLKWHN